MLPFSRLKFVKGEIMPLASITKKIKFFAVLGLMIIIKSVTQPLLHWHINSLFSMALTHLRRTVMATWLWTWWRTETRTSRTCCVETPPCWMPPRRAVWLECRNSAALKTSTAETHRAGTPHHCTLQVTYLQLFTHIEHIHLVDLVF